jgi:hypothetical protein
MQPVVTEVGTFRTAVVHMIDRGYFEVQTFGSSAPVDCEFTFVVVGPC